ncbi:MAG: ATP-grasp domain-containing protein [Halobacteriota archaeon]|uniref:carboxylate--amine ligase n=1 Tax=Natronomonas sp. TaxID=2184060 RepID=UPI0039769E47
MTRARDSVIVPAIGVPSSLAAVRSLGRAGVDVIAVSSDPNPPSFASTYCTRSVVVPSPSMSLSAYSDALLEVLEKTGSRAILPMREADVYALARSSAAFAEHITPMWPSPETLRNAQDRSQLFEAADAVGVPRPETKPLTDWPDHERPVVVKPRYTILVDESDDRARYPGVRVYEPEERPNPDAIVEEMGHRPLLQEFIPNGGEFGYFALFDRGEPVATFQHERIRSHAYGGGASVYRRSVHVPTLDRYGAGLLSELRWHGPAMVEFRRDARDGSFRLMEINPRYWGSLALPIHAGVDFPRYHYQLAVGDVPSIEPGVYDTDVGCHKLRGELLYLYNVYRGVGNGPRPSLGGECASVLRSLYRDPRFDYLDLEDLRPFFADLRNTVGQISAER